MRARRAAQQAFTLIELIIVIAVVGVVLALAVPGLYDYLLVQRAKSVHAQLVTDLQYGRSEAVSRNIAMRFVFRSNATQTCYTLFTMAPGSSTGLRCNCLLGAGSACTNPNATEVRTHAVPRSSGVSFFTPTGAESAFAIDHVSGGLLAIPTDLLSSPLDAFVVDTTIAGPRTLRTTIGRAGRVTYCAPAGALGATPC
jgi:type IV fimbrial biogenesis protein FimT